MIQPQRRAHYAVWLVLPLLLAAVLVAALAFRPPEPRNPGLHWSGVK